MGEIERRAPGGKRERWLAVAPGGQPDTVTIFVRAVDGASSDSVPALLHFAAVGRTPPVNEVHLTLAR